MRQRGTIIVVDDDMEMIDLRARAAERHVHIGDGQSDTDLVRRAELRAAFAKALATAPEASSDDDE